MFYRPEQCGWNKTMACRHYCSELNPDTVFEVHNLDIATEENKQKLKVLEKDKVDVRESTRAKVDEILAQPLSAFVMFGFAQRNLLKKQKPNATPKEVVKAIGACSCAD